MDEASVRRTRSGRAIVDTPSKVLRKGRKKTSSETAEESVEKIANPMDLIPNQEHERQSDAKIKFEMAFDTRNDVEDPLLKVSADHKSEPEDTEMEILNSEMPDDSNSLPNEFNSFKGAESSLDAINNESNSCFEDGFTMSENANGAFEDKNIQDVDMEQDDAPFEETDEAVDGIQAPKVDPNAENISEDELPGVEAAKVPEAEEVSDEELPGPKRAELPADTENVSEEELDTSKSHKRKFEGDENGSQSPNNESKKIALDADKITDNVKEKAKKLPELDKYWKAVNDDSSDFTGWTYLLQYVDQENDTEAAREAYDAFLSHYPYCYGYWRKYADYEKRKGNKKKCEEEHADAYFLKLLWRLLIQVFERGLKAIPLSVDLWLHYLDYVRNTRPDDEDFIRSQYERSLEACGLEFRSDRLWENYIKWEVENKRLLHATLIYERLLATPTQRFTEHFDNFQEHVHSNPTNKVLEVDEFLALRKEVKSLLKSENTETESAENPPGEDNDENTDDEIKAIRERIISIRRKIHKNTSTAVTARWNFEEGIKRPYFHVKPLERCQLKNWQEYLDFEMGEGDKVRVIVLFERCLIACALYEDFWLKYINYLKSHNEETFKPRIKDVFERACTIHHPKKPLVHLQWALHEESLQNFNKAAEVLQNLDKSVPNLLQVAYRRINLERRRGDYEKCAQLYEHYINNSKNKVISTNMAIKYARFALILLKDNVKAIEIINAAIVKDPNHSRLHLQLLDLTLQKEGLKEADVLQIIDSVLEKEAVENDQKILFAQRKVEFLEDFGSDILLVQSAYEDYQKYLKGSKECAKRKESKVDSSKKEKSGTPTTASNSYNNYGNYGNSSNSSYQYNNSQAGGYSQYPQYSQSDQYQYQNWQYQGNYGGYNQWSGYGSGYSYQ